MTATLHETAIAHFVEDVGLFFEQSGLPRMAGRILGRLLISDPPHQSHEKLATCLLASKGSISTMTRLLIQSGLVERIALPGHRRDYFRLKPHAWLELQRAKFNQLIVMRQIAERGLELLGDASTEQRERLEEMRYVFQWFEHELPLLYERLKQEHAARSTVPDGTAAAEEERQ
jgi:DNA-binding transcriptional regulator GbsR (MarR family)